jgi:multisubunit Na+/H+ antiporter MnhB subunit
MDDFWKAAIKYSPGLAISGLLAFTIFPRIVESTYLDALSEAQVYGILVLIASFTFLLCTFIVFKMTNGKKGLGGNVVNVTKSKIGGNVVGGSVTGEGSNKQCEKDNE